MSGPLQVSVLDLVDEVRDFHELFAEARLSTGVILRVLNRKLNYQVGKIVEINPDIVAEAKSVHVTTEGGIVKDRMPTEDDGELSWDPIFGIEDYAPEDRPDGYPYPNPQRQLPVDRFTNLLDSVRVASPTTARAETPVPQRSLATQYPGPYGDNIEFPTLVPMDGCFQLTDLRKVGFGIHGWQAYSPSFYYHAVPYYDLAGMSAGPEATVGIAPGVRAPVILDTASELAKRADLERLAAALEGQYDLASDQLTLNVANIASNVSQVGL